MTDRQRPDRTPGRPLEGATALITGGSRGLGAATARRLARWGARVVVTYRTREQAAAGVVTDCAQHTPGARAEPLDLVEEDSVRSLFERVAERDGSLDLLIANAAATTFRPLIDVQMHHIDKTLAISIRHFLLMVKLARPLLEPRRGRIVAISGADTAGYVPGHGLLAAAKAGLETLVRYLAVELGPRGITTVGVLPGYIDTESIRAMAGPLTEQIRELEEESNPLRRAASPEEASQVVALVCLPEAEWLNGEIVRDDGGRIFAALGRLPTTPVRDADDVPDGDGDRAEGPGP